MKRPVENKPKKGQTKDIPILYFGGSATTM